MRWCIIGMSCPWINELFHRCIKRYHNTAILWPLYLCLMAAQLTTRTTKSYVWRNLLIEFLMVLPSFYLHCLHMIRIVLTLHSKVIYDSEVTRSVLDAVRFIFFVFFLYSVSYVTYCYWDVVGWYHSVPFQQSSLTILISILSIITPVSYTHLTLPTIYSV